MSVKSSVDYRRRFKLAAYTERWAVTMTKVRIRQAVTKTPFLHWHLLTFAGRDGGESRGVVDLIAIHKDHSEPRNGLKRGDSFEIILIQVRAATPHGQQLKMASDCVSSPVSMALVACCCHRGRKAKSPDSTRCETKLPLA